MHKWKRKWLTHTSTFFFYMKRKRKHHESFRLKSRMAYVVVPIGQKYNAKYQHWVRGLMRVCWNRCTKTRAIGFKWKHNEMLEFYLKTLDQLRIWNQSDRESSLLRIVGAAGKPNQRIHACFRTQRLSVLEPCIVCVFQSKVKCGSSWTFRL